MKYFLLLSCFVIVGITSQAQSSFEFQLGGGFNIAHTDIEGENGLHGLLEIHYRPSGAFSIGLMGNLGTLAGQESMGTEEYLFTNNFTQVALRGNLYLINLLSDKADNIDIFLTTGAGLGLSSISKITTPPDDDWGTAYSGADLFIPAGLGIRLPLSSKFAINFQYLYNINFMDELDGYNPQVAANQASDYFSTLSVGLVFRPGGKPSGRPNEEMPDGEDLMTQNEEQDTEEPEPAVTEEPQENTETEQEVKPTEEQKEEINEPTPPNEQPEEEETSEPAEEEDTPQQQDLPSAEENEEEPIPDTTGEESVFKDFVFNTNGGRANQRYYVIGASFSNMSQAQEYQFEMAGKGYATLIVTDYNRNVYRISFGAFMDLAEAKKLANKLQKEHDPDTWIIENTRPE